MSFKLITCILSTDKAANMIEYLKEQKGIITADRSSARGTTVLNQNGVEMATLTVLVDQKDADWVFEYIFFEADLNKPHQGIIYQQNITKASEYKIPRESEDEKI